MDSHTHTYKKMNLEPYLTPYTETNLKWIINQIKVKFIKLLGDLRKNLSGPGFWDFLNTTQEVQTLKRKSTNWTSHLKDIWSSNNKVKKVKRQYLDKKKIFVKHVSDKAFISRLYILNYLNKETFNALGVY